MEPIHLTVDRDDVVILQGLLLKARATELSELRRLQTQLSVYGDRRANMESEPAAIEARIAVLTRLLDQMLVGGATMTGMQAAVRDRYGSPDVVELREVERPTPVDDEVLVRVRAASVNRADLDGITPRPSFVRLFIGLARAEEPSPRASMSPASSKRRSGRDPVPAGRRGLRGPVLVRAGRLRRVRLRPGDGRSRRCRRA